MREESRSFQSGTTRGRWSRLPLPGAPSPRGGEGGNSCRHFLLLLFSPQPGVVDRTSGVHVKGKPGSVPAAPPSPPSSGRS